MKKYLYLMLVLSPFCFGEPECSGYKQIELNACAGQKFEIADAELNRLYKLQMGYLKSDSAKTAFKNSQLAWIKFRDATCEYEAPYHQGSMWAMEINTCKAKHTIARVKDFESYVECRDNGCPY